MSGKSRNGKGPHGGAGTTRSRASGLRRLVLAIFAAGWLAAGSAGPRTSSTEPAHAAALSSPSVAPAVPQVQVVSDQILVKFEPGTSPAVVSAVLARAGATPEDVVRDVGVRVVTVDPADRREVLAALENSPAVEYAEPDLAMRALDTTPNDPSWPDQWGPRKVEAPRAWDTTRGSGAVVVAVVDTGVDGTEPDLAGALVAGTDFVNGDSDASDDQGHGTSVAEIIGARTNNGEGQAGLCWTCRIMPVKVLDQSGVGSTATIAQGIVWATDHGADIVNLSLGGSGTSQTLADAVAYAARKGVLLFGAAGNSGTNTAFYPAAYSGVLSVAATDESDQLYSWSNYGSWVAVAAPGCNVAPLLGATNTAGGQYGTFCGTSSATPVVSGIAGLALAAAPAASASNVYSALEHTAKAIGTGVRFGRVNATQTLSALGASSTTVTYTGTVKPSRRTRTFSRAVNAGPLTLRLRFASASSLTLRLVDGSGNTIAQRSSASPVTISRTVSAGSYKFVVKGGAKTHTSFTLSVTYRSA